MKQRKLIVAGALLAAGALALTACSGSSSGSGSGSGSKTNTAASLTIYGTKPENPLIPANTNEVGGGNILDAIFRGLVKYNPDTAAPELSMAASIASPDNLVWTIKLKPGQTFQDGSPVDSASFINAWNWAAYEPNGALNNYFFAPIKGYDDLNPVDPDGPTGPKKAPTPKTKTMSGLKLVSPTEFIVTLSSKQSFFPVEVGYSAFSPLPPAFFSDPVAFGKKPIGNGPFQLVSGDGDTGYTLKKWAGYKGTDQPKIGSVTFKTYTDPAAGYADLLAGNLDFMDQVPPADLVNNQYQKDLPGRYVNKAVGVIQTATLPEYNANFKNNSDIGKALSMAIDRPTITKAVFNGSRTPATGWVSPIVNGYKAGACGTYCTYNPTAAKAELAKSAFKGPFTFSYNADGQGNKETAEAICNSIHTALDVTCTAHSYVDFASLRQDVNAHKMTSMFRTGWQMDYPSIEDFLEPLYSTGAGSNDGLYSNAQFDSLIKKADGETGAAGLADYQSAEDILSQTMSIIPLWYTAQQSGWSSRLSNVHVTPFSTLDLTDVTAK